jgi:uncharacterized OB-fold protein
MKKPLPPEYKCKNCGRTTTYHRLRCLSCRGEKFEKTPLPDRAKLLTFTEIHMLPWGFDQRFLRVGVVEFPDAARATGWIAFDGARMGMPVEVRWEPIREDYGEMTYGFVFYPAG